MPCGRSHHRTQPSSDSSLDVYFDAQPVLEPHVMMSTDPKLENRRRGSFADLSHIHPAFRIPAPDLSNLAPSIAHDHPVPFRDILPTSSMDVMTPESPRRTGSDRQALDLYFNTGFSTVTLVPPCATPIVTTQDSATRCPPDAKKPSYEDLFPSRGRCGVPRRLSGFRGTPTETFNTPNSVHPSNVDDSQSRFGPPQRSSTFPETSSPSRADALHRSHTWSNASPARGPGRRIGWWNKTPSECDDGSPLDTDNDSDSTFEDVETEEEEGGEGGEEEKEEKGGFRERSKRKLLGLMGRKKDRAQSWSSMGPDSRGRIVFGTKLSNAAKLKGAPRRDSGT